MNLNVRYICSVVSPVIMVSLFVMSFVMGCHRRVDPLLSDVDTKMEEYPDSAMLLLDSYTLSDNTSDYDRAYYGMLLTHARYKNFIDETNDSLISLSTDYFLEHGYKALASRSLFLQGMIQMNANRLGEAAVSFSKGLDIAKESKQYMWEGQCARGLRMIYESLHDGSAQVKYAGEEHKAFLKSNDKSWQDYSEFELAMALNNNCKYEKTLSVLDSLDNRSSIMNDTLILSQIAQLRGLALFGLGKFEESLKNYVYSYELNHETLSENDIRNIRIVLRTLYNDSIPESLSEFLKKLKVKNTAIDAFDVLFSEGDYKKAYESIVRYKNEQDSVLSVIFKNNVSESVTQYETMNSILAMQKLRTERLSYWFMFLFLLVISIFCYWRYRERIHKEESKRLMIEADLESLRSDLLSQLESARKVAESNSVSYDNEKVDDFEKIIKSRFADINRLCDDYYQGNYRKAERNEMSQEIESFVKNFVDTSNIDKIIDYIDEQSCGLYSAFKKDFFELANDHLRLFLYLMLGFNSRTISVLLGQSINVVYNKKSRLKAKIEKREILKKDEYLKFF